jgi:hypothetical protein
MNDNQTTTIETPPVDANPFAEHAAQEAATKPKKTTFLSRATTRKRRRPFLGLLYGPPGAGKTSFAASAENAIIIPAERGVDQISGVIKMPTPETFKELWQMVLELDTLEHEGKTIALDTLDATELLIFDHVIDEQNQENEKKGQGHRAPKCKSIEEYGGGYGKGYVRAREIWTGLLIKLSEMSERFNILLLAHSQLKTINSPPLGASFDQYSIKIDKKSADIVRQMADFIMFVDLDISIQKDNPKARKGRGLVSGDRLLWTQPSTGIEAKNRYNLESPMEFSWAALEAGIEKFYS